MFDSPYHAARSTSRALLALPAALVLVLSGCGGSSADDDEAAAASSTEGAFPVTVTGADGELTLDEQPDTIVSMSATSTEMLFAIGAGDQVEAVDDNSNYPEDAPITELSSFTPNAEAIAEYAPDLVVLSDDLNGIVDALDALSVPTLLLPAAETLDDSYEQLDVLGDATGHAEGADEVIADMQDRIAAAADSVPAQAQGLRVYHELDPSFYSAASNTFIGSIYSQLGLENIADGAPDAAGGYPQLSAEYIAGQAPALIVLADTKCCGETAESVAQRPAFGALPAVQEGRILETDDDIASRWGPRIAEFAEAVADTLQG
ncbi:MAG: Vitamin B12 ABC transporter, substrate-binding protein BtuF [uncultured Blastococcus sp.]|uniref:Vitamin B12 ABC transporter, substrate-binding protein BtuF n=1 Tax=uncultured Blastococcus sp. TaxID=217144 RepID=A0A6J4H0X7_9ACTN|nr:MAG: Vitamin B12 ABC transporter, substrate-binding protein BtuF [uncultured Blastococcus sp.]